MLSVTLGQRRGDVHARLALMGCLAQTMQSKFGLGSVIDVILGKTEKVGQVNCIAKCDDSLMRIPFQSATCASHLVAHRTFPSLPSRWPPALAATTTNRGGGPLAPCC